VHDNQSTIDDDLSRFTEYLRTSQTVSPSILSTSHSLPDLFPSYTHKLSILRITLLDITLIRRFHLVESFGGRGFLPEILTRRAGLSGKIWASPELEDEEEAEGVLKPF